jgi:hypothetical protein
MSSIAQYIAGVVFAGVALLFLWRAFTHPGAPNTLQTDIVHFVCAFCAGASGAFLAGGAILDANLEWAADSKFVVQGTAGVALFVLVFLVFRLRPAAPAPASNVITVSIGTETPFKQVAETLADEAGATIDLRAFNAGELAVIPRSEQLRTGSLLLARRSLERLGNLVPSGSVRPYTVQLHEPTKHFTLKV